MTTGMGACGASMSMNMNDDPETESSTSNASNTRPIKNDPFSQNPTGAAAGTAGEYHSSTATTTGSVVSSNSRNSRSATTPNMINEKHLPPKKPYSHYHGGGKQIIGATASQDLYDHDHHTFATATTASATISYSTDEVDLDHDSGVVNVTHVTSVGSSEAGMEVVMSEEPLATPPAELPYISHSFQAGKHTFTVDTRYSFLRVIGSGAYGVVISAKDDQTHSDVAIKMVPRAFNDEIDAKRILREIKLLKHFRHENIVSLIDMMPPEVQRVEDFHDVYLVTDLMETDLHRIIYSKQKLSLDHVQYFTYQVLRGLKYIHSCNVLHRDLKPSNLLVNSNCDLKICDFGLARGIHDSSSMDEDDNGRHGTMLLTEYVVTRWYRAPEIMLACHEYSKPIDLWSVGCIFAELLLRKPYFPGDDYIDQLTIISEKLGKLPESDLDFVTSEKAKRFMRKLPNKTSVPLTQQFPSASPEALELMKRMLSIHPEKRITVEGSLSHPFFNQLHSPDDEPITDRGYFDFTFENQSLHRVRLQELIWQEVGSFRPSCLPVPVTKILPSSTRSRSSRGLLDLSLTRSRSRSSQRKDP